MCFERTEVRPFHRGYKIMPRTKEGYVTRYEFLPLINAPVCPTIIKVGEWVDEMAFRDIPDLLSDDKTINFGWHIFEKLKDAQEWNNCGSPSQAILHVECYGHKPPYGTGSVIGKTAGRFQFMKILEEVT